MNSKEQNKNHTTDGIARGVGAAGVSMAGAGLGIATGAAQLDDSPAQPTDSIPNSIGDATTMATEVNDFEEITYHDDIPADIEEVVIHPSSAPDPNDGVNLDEIFRKEQRIRPTREEEEKEEKKLSVVVDEEEKEDAQEEDHTEDVSESDSNAITSEPTDTDVICGEYIDPTDVEAEAENLFDFGEVYAIEGNGNIAADVFYTDGSQTIFIDSDNDGIFDTEVFPDDPDYLRDITQRNFSIDDAYCDSKDGYFESSRATSDYMDADADIIDPSMG